MIITLHHPRLKNKNYPSKTPLGYSRDAHIFTEGTEGRGVREWVKKENISNCRDSGGMTMRATNAAPVAVNRAA